MSRISRNLNIAWRAERMIARRRLAVVRTQTGLMAFSGLVAGIGVIMLNVGIFFWLASHYGNANAGLILAAGNFALAVVLAVFAARMSAERELEPVAEVRDMAVEDLEAEISQVVSEVRDLSDNVRRIARDPLGTAGSSLIGPALVALLKSLNKKS
ncbi:MAG: hypothetical protein AAGF74_05395 [Pseudomonadota bacterium]